MLLSGGLSFAYRMYRLGFVQKHSGGRVRVGRPTTKEAKYDYKPSRKRLASILVGIGYRWGIYRS